VDSAAPQPPGDARPWRGGPAARAQRTRGRSAARASQVHHR